METNNKTFEDYAKILREAVPYNDNIAKIKFVTKADNSSLPVHLALAGRICYY
jgi:hypothetical protein